MVYLKAKTIQALWPRLVKKVMKEGRNVLDERGSETKELLNVVWTVTDPEACEDPKGNPFGGGKLEAYKNQLLDPELHGHPYTYGNRLRAVKNPNTDVLKKYPGNTLKYSDQIQQIINHLIVHPETRRATATTWNRFNDPFSEEVPCLIMVDFKIRNDKLFTTAVWRSHDCMTALPANLFALRELARHVAKNTKTELGDITVQSISCHIYEVYWQEARNL